MNSHIRRITRIQSQAVRYHTTGGSRRTDPSPKASDQPRRRLTMNKSGGSPESPESSHRRINVQRTHKPPDGHAEEREEMLSRRRPNVPDTDGQLYVLTLRTDDSLHETMTGWRDKYFPKELNHLEAHLTLFHALPESKLESDVVPAIRNLISETSSFELFATTPYRLGKGIAVGMPKDHGGIRAQAVHSSLVKEWKSFLSHQDQSFKAHYTIMNKVSEATKVEEAFERFQQEYQARRGRAIGLSLYKYMAPTWEWKENFDFRP